MLSVCNTIAGDKRGAEALSGLARAFFYAGARALLVSHWAVDVRFAPIASEPSQRSDSTRCANALNRFAIVAAVARAERCPEVKRSLVAKEAS